MHVEHDIGIGYTHRRTLFSHVAEVVHYTILNAISHKFRVWKIAAVHCGVNHESRLGTHIFLPLYVANHIIKLIRIVGRELLYRLQYAQRCAAAKIGLVHQLKVALETYHPTPCLHVFRAKAYQFVAKHIFQSLEGLGYHRILIFHHSLLFAFLFSLF